MAQTESQKATHFKKGEVANPNGSSKLARARKKSKDYLASLGDKPIKKIAKLMDDSAAGPTVQLAAAKDLEDRLNGKALQAVKHSVSAERKPFDDGMTLEEKEFWFGERLKEGK